VPPTFGAASFGKLRQCQTASSNGRSHIEQVLGQIISGVFTLNFELIKSLEHFSAALDHPTGTKQQLFRACDALDRIIQIGQNHPRLSSDVCSDYLVCWYRSNPRGYRRFAHSWSQIIVAHFYLPAFRSLFFAR
jgi:hypothetical protein